MNAPIKGCDKGHFCPEGTLMPFQFPCPAGTKNKQTNADDVTKCIPCNKDTFCTRATVDLELPCAPGHMYEAKKLYPESYSA